MNSSFKIIFMGTPEFAVPALRALHDSEDIVDLVVTQPDRPKGRGRKSASPPVKEAARKLGYEIMQPDAVNTEEVIETLRKRQPDLFVVIAYGHILPKRVLEIPRLAPINLHASLLPKYRGPAPIQWAIINGEPETGITSMLMDKGLDTGEMLTIERMHIHPDETAGTLHDKLSELAAEVLLKTLKGFRTGNIRPISQNHAEATYAPLLKKSDGHIDWQKPAEEIERTIRGLNPWPGTYMFEGDRRLKVFRAKVVASTGDEVPGTVLPSFSDELRVAAGKDALSILEIQEASGKRIDIREFLKGRSIEPGTLLK